MIATLQTQMADPVERLRAVAESNTIAKEHSAAIGATLLEDWMQLGGRAHPRDHQAGVRPGHPVQTDVQHRGVQLPRTEAGRLLHGRQSHSLLPGRAGHARRGAQHHGVHGGGKLNVGLISCPDVLPDLPEIADGLTTGLNQLLAQCV